MSIKNILVPTDFSDHARRAFEHAYALACGLGARLHVLHVREDSSLRIAIREGLLKENSTDDEVRQVVEKLINERIAELLATVDCTRIEILAATKRGDSKAIAVAYAMEIKADIVVVGRRGVGLMEGIRTTLLGSVTEALIKKSPCPVMVVRREHLV